MLSRRIAVANLRPPFVHLPQACYLSRVATPIEHFRALVNELSAGLSRRYGWKKTVAEILGIHQSTLTRLMDGSTAELSERLMAAICLRTGISRDFFEANDEERSVTDFLSVSDAGDDWVSLQGLRDAAGLYLWKHSEGEATSADAAKLVKAVALHSPEHVALAISAALGLSGVDGSLANPLSKPVRPEILARSTVEYVDTQPGPNADQIGPQRQLIELIRAGRERRNRDDSDI